MEQLTQKERRERSSGSDGGRDENGVEESDGGGDDGLAQGEEQETKTLDDIIDEYAGS